MPVESQDLALASVLYQHFRSCPGKVYLDSVYELLFIRHYSLEDIQAAVRELERSKMIKIHRRFWRSEVEVLNTTIPIR